MLRADLLFPQSSYENQGSHRSSSRISKPYRVTNGKKFRLKDVDPGDTGELKSEDKPRAKEALRTGVGALTELQDMLYAQDRWSLLLIFQAMDAAGKDGTIKHVMSGVNPQGCQVSSFKGPTSRSRSRLSVALRRRSCRSADASAFSTAATTKKRSSVRVHPEFLAGQKLPEECVTKQIWDERFQDIRASSATSPQRHDRAEIFPARFERRAEEALSRAPRSAGEELEVLRERREGARAFGTTTWRPTRRRSARRRRRIRRGMWCRQITSGSRA